MWASLFPGSEKVEMLMSANQPETVSVLQQEGVHGASQQVMPALAAFYPPLRRVLGAFLLAAALFKFMAAFVDYSFPQPALTDDFFHFSLAGLECVIGALLIVGAAEVSAWLITLAFFFASALFNAYWVAIGKASCDCFGSIPVSPVLMGSFSTLVFCALLLSRPVSLATLPDATWSGMFRRLLYAGLIGICLILVGTPLVLTSVAVLAPRFFDDRVITPQSAIVDAGEEPARISKVINVQLRNHSSSPVTLLGGSRVCGCDVTRRLPLTIPPAEVVEIPVRIMFGSQPGRFTSEMTFYTNSPANPELHIKYSGVITERATE
jgi:hypothetical protein